MQEFFIKNLYSAFLIFRLIVLAIFLYVFREPILDFVGSIFDIYNITVMAIQIVGTPVSRLALAIVTFIILTILAYVTRKWPAQRRFWVLMSTGSFMAAVAFLVPNPTKTGCAFLILSIGILSLNLLPDVLTNTASHLSAWIDRIVRWIPGTGLLFSTVYARELGFEIDPIRELLALAGEPNRRCESADRIATAHLADIDHKIARLTALRTEVARMADCSNHSVSDCRVIEVLGDHGECLHETH